MYFAGLFPRDERTLSPAFRRDATSFSERNVRVADVQWALPNDDAPVRGAGRVRRLVCTPVRPSVSRDTPRRARVHPETGLEVPVFFLTTKFLQLSRGQHSLLFGHMEHHYRLAQNIWRFDWAFALGLRTEVANCIFQPRNVCDLLLILPPIWFGLFAVWKMVRAKARPRENVFGTAVINY